MDLLGKIFKSPKQNNIFVQIYSYRDPDLTSTIRDLLNKASNPDNLKICVLNQWHPDDNIDLSEFKDNSRIKLMSVEYNLSQGVCWARNIINKEFSNEKYTLQINSHHRFIKGWDTELIKMLDILVEKGHKKPILTTYLPSNSLAKGKQPPFQISFKEFSKSGDIITVPTPIGEANEPIPTQFFSSNFVFTLGRFCQDVPYDPQMYFNSEEITMAVRAYTNGYDSFIPHKIILYHNDIHENTPKYQDDCEHNNEKEGLSNDRTKKLLEIDGSFCSPCLKKRLGEFYLGNIRSKDEYEEFSGIHFNNRSVTLHTQDQFPPPGPKFVGDFKSQFYKRQYYKIIFHKDKLENNVDFDFWAVILMDEKNVEIHRQDFDSYTIKNIIENSKSAITLGGSYKGRPYTKWVVWPHKDKWLNRISGVDKK